MFIRDKCIRKQVKDVSDRESSRRGWSGKMSLGKWHLNRDLDKVGGKPYKYVGEEQILR